MGLLGSLFGSKGSSSSTTKQTTKQTETAQQDTESTQNQTQSRDSASTASTSSLDQTSLESLRSLIPTLTGQAQAGVEQQQSAVNQLIAQAVSQAGGQEERIRAAGQATQDAAKSNFTKNEERELAQVSQALGSRFGSSAQLLRADADANLAANLAAIQRQTELDVANSGDASLANLINTIGQSGNASVDNLSQIANILKGAETQQTAQASEQSTLVNIINQLVNSTSTLDSETVGTGNTSTKSRGPILAPISL